MYDIYIILLFFFVHSGVVFLSSSLSFVSFSHPQKKEKRKKERKKRRKEREEEKMVKKSGVNNGLATREMSPGVFKFFWAWTAFFWFVLVVIVIIVVVWCLFFSCG